MEQREKLIELLDKLDVYDDWLNNEAIADLLIANGVVVLPCRCGGCEYAMTSKRLEKEKVACLYMMYPHDKNCFCYHAKRKGGDSDD